MERKEHYISVPNVEKVGVYAIFNSKTLKYYVGSSVNIKRRMKEHRAKIESLSGSNIRMENDLRSFEDVKNFSFIVLESFEDFTITEDELREKELYYIKKYDAWNGYNDTFRTPNKSGYYGMNEFLSCRKSSSYSHKDISKMTNKTLLNLYAKMIRENKKELRGNLRNVEYEILKRMDKLSTN